MPLATTIGKSRPSHPTSTTSVRAPCAPSSEKAGFEVADVRTGNVYLGRYRLPIWTRIPMEIVLQTGTLLGMGAKVLALGRKG